MEPDDFFKRDNQKEFIKFNKLQGQLVGMDGKKLGS